MNENLKRHRPDIKAVGEGKALAYMPEDPMGVWVHIQEVRDLLNVKDRIVAAKAAEIEDLKKKLAEYEDCATNACAERDDNQTAIDELNAENEALKALVASPTIPVKLKYADGFGPDGEFELPRNLPDFCCAVFEAGQENRDILIDGAPIYGPVI